MTFRAASLLFLLTPALALGACHRQEPAGNTAAAAPGVDYAGRIAAMPEGQRDGVLLRAIRDAGQDCQGVTRSVAGGASGGRPAWTATCTDGKTWVLILGPDGTMNVLDPAQVRGTG